SLCVTCRNHRRSGCCSISTRTVPAGSPRWPLTPRGPTSVGGRRMALLGHVPGRGGRGAFPQVWGRTGVDAGPQNLDMRVHDRVALDEIELYSEMLSAVATADRPLTTDEIDMVLGIGHGTRS